MDYGVSFFSQFVSVFSISTVNHYKMSLVLCKEIRFYCCSVLVFNQNL